MAHPSLDTLPLTRRTPTSWATRALERPLDLLVDHAHLERKAASNALALLGRWPDTLDPERWSFVLAGIARDEAEHLALVLRLLHRRGGRFAKFHDNPYAKALRAQVRTGGGPDELVDRLCVSALIELRSCERFALLGDAAAEEDLVRLYRALWASEHGHYASFVELAGAVAGESAAHARWTQWLAIEGEAIAAQPAGPRLHAGWES